MKLIHTLFPTVLAVLAITPVFAQGPRIDIHLNPQPAISGGCPARVHFTGQIRTFEPLEVTYQWLRSDGAHSEHTVNFGRPGPHPVGDTWTISRNYSGWVQLVILAPKHLQTIKANFSVNCGR